MSDLYCIANNPKLRIEIFSEYHDAIFGGDVLHFNTLQFFQHFELHPRNIIFHNTNIAAKDWFGKDRLEYYMKYSVKDRYLLFLETMNTPEWTLKAKTWESSGGKLLWYKGKGHRIGNSAGFMCYNHFSEYYDRIFLIGFTFEGSSIHSWDYEKKVMLNDPKVTPLV